MAVTIAERYVVKEVTVSYGDEALLGFRTWNIERLGSSSFLNQPGFLYIVPISNLRQSL